MENRYTILQHETRTFYLVDCPILLVSHAITKDNQNNTIFVQCKFENTLSKPIKALYISVKCYDVTNQSLSDVESFSYLDVLVKQYETFGDKMGLLLVEDEEEKTLFDAIVQAPQITFENMGDIKFFVNPLHNFFDKVLVMAEDEDIKNNRLNLLGILANRFNSICDFSKIVSG